MGDHSCAAFLPLEPRRLMAITTSFAEVPISSAAIAADPKLVGYRTFDLHVTVDAADAWEAATLHLTLRRGQLYMPDPTDYGPEPGEWPSRPNVEFASTLSQDNWLAPPDVPGSLFNATHVDAVCLATDGHEVAARHRTITVARLTLSSDASGVILSQVVGQDGGRLLFAPTRMSDIYRGRVYRTNNGYISGTLFDDRNGDGDRDQHDEEPPGGRTVYLDADNDGVLDPGERRTTTDARGFYEFYALPAGKYKVRQVVPAAFHQTTPHHNFGWSVHVWAGHIEQRKDFGSCATGVAPASTARPLFENRNIADVLIGEAKGASNLDVEAAINANAEEFASSLL